MTYSEALDSDIRFHCGKLRPRAAKENERLPRKHLLSGATQLDQISKNNIVHIVDELSPALRASRAHASKSFFNWRMRRDYTSAHPNTAYSVPISVKERDRTRTDAELIPIYRIAARIGTPVGNSMQVLILTGQRRRDGAALQAGWIGEARSRFPKKTTKSNRKFAASDFLQQALTIRIVGDNQEKRRWISGDRAMRQSIPAMSSDHWVRRTSMHRCSAPGSQSRFAC